MFVYATCTNSYVSRQYLATMISPEQPALLIRDFKTQKTFIITRSDIIRVLT